MNVVVHSDHAKLEEGVLRLAYTGKSEDEVVDNAKRGALGIGWRNETVHVLFFVFDLKVLSVSGQHNVRLVSPPFRGVFYWFSHDVVEILKHEHEYHGHASKWYEGYRTELASVWSQFNDLLARDG